MVLLQAVIEVPRIDVAAVPWPVASMAPGSWLALDAGADGERVGLFVAALVDGIEAPSRARPEKLVDALLAEDSLIVTGGLRVRDDDAGAVVVPGCCAGLEGWRDWLEILDGGSPWLGHNPDPEVEVVGDVLRVWQDRGQARDVGPWAGVHVDVPRAALSQLLAGVHRDLVGFLTALTAWAEGIGMGPRGHALAEAIDRDFDISAPLPWSIC